MPTDSEERLISVLKSDVRASVSDIARNLKVSRATVQARIAKLEKEGIIAGYTLVLGKDYLRQTISAHVSIATAQRASQIVSSGLMKIEQVSAVHAISGEYDMIAIIHALNTEQLSHLIDHIGSLEGVIRTNTAVILETKEKR